MHGGEERCVQGFGGGNLRKRKHLGDPGIDGRIILNLWRRNYFFLILAHPVYKILIIQQPNTLEL